MLETNTDEEVAQHFFMMLERNEHYRNLPERPLKKVFVSDVSGKKEDFSLISEDRRKAIAEGIMKRIKEHYVLKEEGKEVVTQ